MQTGLTRRTGGAQMFKPAHRQSAVPRKDIARVAAVRNETIAPSSPWMSIIGAVAAAAITLAPPALAGDVLVGQARVVDGDTVEVAGRKIRLYGMDAPEKAQSCSAANGAAYACGQQSLEVLKSKVGERQLLCDVKNTDQYGRTVAACSIEGKEDIGKFMVSNGYAVAYREYAKEYIPFEEEAKAAKKGIWAGSFQKPADWRKEQKAAALLASVSTSSSSSAAQQPAALAVGGSQIDSGRTTPPDANCAIKGNISANGDKIFHVPGGRSYNQVAIDIDKGEKWFCTEDAALAGGWRKAKA